MFNFGNEVEVSVKIDGRRPAFMRPEVRKIVRPSAHLHSVDGPNAQQTTNNPRNSGICIDAGGRETRANRPEGALHLDSAGRRD